MAYFLSNISAKYYENPVMLSRVIAKNIGDGFWDTVYNNFGIKNIKTTSFSWSNIFTVTCEGTMCACLLPTYASEHVENLSFTIDLLLKLHVTNHHVILADRLIELLRILEASKETSNWWETDFAFLCSTLNERTNRSM